MKIGTDGLEAEVEYHGGIHLRRGNNALSPNIILSAEEFAELVRQGEGGMVEEMRQKAIADITAMIRKMQARLNKLEGK